MATCHFGAGIWAENQALTYLFPAALHAFSIRLFFIGTFPILCHREQIHRVRLVPQLAHAASHRSHASGRAFSEEGLFEDAPGVRSAPLDQIERRAVPRFRGNK